MAKKYQVGDKVIVKRDEAFDATGVKKGDIAIIVFRDNDKTVSCKMISGSSIGNRWWFRPGYDIRMFENPPIVSHMPDWF